MPLADVAAMRAIGLGDLLPEGTRDIRCTYGDSVAHIRFCAELSREQLAKLADVTPAYLASLEAGQEGVVVDTSLRIAGALTKRLRDLMPGWKGEISAYDLMTGRLLPRT